MKKFSWILALLAALAVVFVGVGCGGGGGGDDPDVDLTKPDLVLEGADIEIVKIGSTAGQTVEGNKYILKTTGGADVGSAGFGYAFSDAEKEYKFVKLEVKITAIDANSCAAFTIKKNTGMDDLAGFGSNSSPQYSRNAELNVGDKVNDEAKAVEMKKDEIITDQFLTNLFTGGMYFQFNHYAEYWKPATPPLPHQDAAIHAKLKGDQDFTIEVTKVTFTNGGKPSEDIELTADHFSVGNSRQYKDNGAITAVTVTANGGIDVGKIDIFYKTGEAAATATVPQALGEHDVLIDVAGAEGYKPATKLKVGTLVVEQTPPAALFDLTDWLKANTTIAFGSRPLQANSSVTYTVTATAIQITNVASTNDGLDLWISGANSLDLNPAVNQYEVVIKGKALTAPSGDSGITAQGGATPYTGLGSVDIKAANDTFEITKILPKTYLADGADNGKLVRLVVSYQKPVFDFEVTVLTVKNLGAWDD